MMKLKYTIFFVGFFLGFIDFSIGQIKDKVFLEFYFKVRPNPFNEKSVIEEGVGYFKDTQYYKIENDHYSTLGIKLGYKFGKNTIKIGYHRNLLDFTYKYKMYYFVPTIAKENIPSGNIYEERLKTYKFYGTTLGYSRKIYNFDVSMNVTVDKSSSFDSMKGFGYLHTLYDEDFNKLAEYEFSGKSSSFGVNDLIYLDFQLKYFISPRWSVGVGVNVGKKEMERQNYVKTEALGINFHAPFQDPFQGLDHPTVLNSTKEYFKISGFFFVTSFEIF